jgi:FtsZ-binding cell division protein ZapB
MKPKEEVLKREIRRLKRDNEALERDNREWKKRVRLLIHEKDDLQYQIDSLLHVV